MEKLTVVLADDHKIFRDGIKSLLSKEKNIVVVGEASCGNEAIIETVKHKPHVVIMDIDMGTPNGIETTQILQEKCPDSKVLILSMLGLHEYIIKALEAGAVGYILKNAGKEELLTAIQSVANGDSYFSKEVSSVLIAHLKNPKTIKTQKTDIPLSPREIEVLKLIAQEHSNTEIANKLFISVRTVDTHKRNLLEKLGVRNSVGLTKFAISKGLV